MTDSSSSLGLGAEMEPSLHTSNMSLNDGDTSVSSSNNGGSAPQSHSASAAIHRASLGSETDGLVLFDLTTKQGAKVAFSPHVCIASIFRRI
jgi:hypothetical protein